MREWTHLIEFPALLGDEGDGRFESFNKDPGLYAFVLDRDIKHVEANEESDTSPRDAGLIETIVPIGLAYLDCSTFQVQNSSVVVSRSQKFRGVSLCVELERKAVLLSEEESLKLEPFVLNIETLSDYPVQSGEHQNDALEACYMYGVIQFSPGSSRNMLARPVLVESPAVDEYSFLRENAEVLSLEMESEDNTVESPHTPNRINNGRDENKFRRSVPVRFASCIFPALGDEGVFRELLANSTFKLKIFNEDLISRLITPEILEAYNNMLPWNAEKYEGIGTAADAKEKFSTPNAGQELLAPNHFLPEGHQIHKSDEYLIDRLWDALDAGGKILYHGSVSFRVEQVLSLAEDRLMEFARKRDPDLSRKSIVISDNILGEIRLEKPSCPIKWKMPPDLSLRTALKRSFPGNSAHGHVVGSANRRPRHEKFHRNTSCLAIKIELYRSYKHPERTPSVIGINTLNKIRDPGGAYLQTTTRTGLASTLSETKTLRETFSFLNTNGTQTQESGEGIEPAKEVQQRLRATPFNRMVFVFRYDDSVTLEAINGAVSKVNLAALTNIQGSLRSYNFTAEEIIAAAGGYLDVVCGFTLIDNNTRIVVIEGLAGPDKGMQEVYLDVPRLQPNSESLRILCNPEVLFPDRLYTAFGPDIKRIRIRENLSKLSQKPEIYDRNQVSESCFEAIDKLMALKSAVDLKVIKDLSIFPEINGLNELELLYGEAISRIDLDGALSGNRTNTDFTGEKNIKRVINKTNDTSASTTFISPLSKKGVDDSNPQSRRRCPPTDCHNLEFKEYIKNRPKHFHDRIRENLKVRKEAMKQSSENRRQRDEADRELIEEIFGSDAHDGKAKIHSMANHSINFKELAKSKWKEKYRRIKDTTFTFSRDFVSQTICLGKDPNEGVPVEEAKKHWLTPSGFMANKPRSKEELLKHPKRPSDGRIEDLKTPFEEPVGLSSAHSGNSIEQILMEKGFKTRFESIKFFGINKPIKFSREINTRNIGDSEKLPRGKSVAGEYGDVDKEYWKSIFNGGETIALQMQNDAVEEKKKWHEKVVVDSLSVKVGGFKVREKTIPVDRTKDILRDEPQKNWAKRLRDRKSATGKFDLSHQEAPFTAMNIGEWVPNALANSIKRTSNKSEFMTTKDHDRGVKLSHGAIKAGKERIKMTPGQDFVRFIGSKARVPKSQTIIVKRPVPLFSGSGKTGSHDFMGDPRWQRPPDSII